MRTQSRDTSPEMEQKQIELLRAMGVEGRLRLALSLSQTGIQLSQRAMQLAHPDATKDELKALFVTYNYGPDLGRRFAEYLARHIITTNNK